MAGERWLAGRQAYVAAATESSSYSRNVPFGFMQLLREAGATLRGAAGHAINLDSTLR